MGKAKILSYLDFEGPKEASEPEKCWWEGTELHYSIQEFSKKWSQRVDTRKYFDLGWVKKVDIYLGANKAFKGIVIDLGNFKEGEMQKISKTHRDLARDIVETLKKNGIEAHIKRVKRSTKT